MCIAEMTVYFYIFTVFDHIINLIFSHADNRFSRSLEQLQENFVGTVS